MHRHRVRQVHELRVVRDHRRPAGREHPQQRRRGLPRRRIAQVETEVGGGDRRLELGVLDEAGDVHPVGDARSARRAHQVHLPGHLADDQQVDPLEPRRGERRDRRLRPLDRGLEAEGAGDRRVVGHPEAAAHRQSRRAVGRRRQRDPHRHRPHPQLRVVLAHHRRRPGAVHQDAALPPQQRPLRRQGEDRRLAVGPPALAARRRAADPAVVGRQPLLVGLVLAAAEGLVEEEVVEHEVVEGQHAGPLERQRQHTRVVAVVPHLVEGEPAVGAGLLGRHRVPARLDLRRHRLAGQAHQPHVGPRRQLGQEVERVVGDPRADGRERGNDVEAQVGGRHGPLGGGGGYAGSSSCAPGSAICPLRNASTKRSRSPSSTRSASPISAPVRWSLTSR